MLIKNNNGVYQIRELLLPGLVHGFSTKGFGNLSYKYGQKPEVDKNRSLFAKAIGIKATCVIQAGLVHDTNIVEVTEKDCDGLNEGKYIENTDALITNTVGVVLWILTGDCAPFIFFDPKKKIMALAHCGWNGTMGKLPVLVYSRLLSKYGCRPEDILIGIGPTIEKCHYIKTSPVSAQQLPEWWDFLKEENGKVAVDLNGFSINQLIKVGVPRGNIFYSNFCTFDNGEFFFSQQREKVGLEEAGRFATVVQMV